MQNHKRVFVGCLGSSSICFYIFTSMAWKLEYTHDRLGSEKGEFQYARGLSISEKTGSIVITDIANKRIQILNSKYEYLHDWKVNINGTLLCPLDVHRVDDNVVAAAIEGHATLWQCPDVEDYRNTEIKLLHTFGNEEFVFPRSILKHKGQYLITDVGKHRLTVHSDDGTLIRSIGSLGTDNAKNFNWPYYICTDDKGRIAVSDSHNRCVKLFDENLEYLGNFGKEELTCCAGVVYSKENGGRFFVLDYDTHHLYEYSSEGKLIECIDDKMAFPGQSVRHMNGRKLVCSMHHGFFVYSK